MSRLEMMHKLQKQIEFYFSEINWKTDKFFHSKLIEGKKLNVYFICTCGKIKELKATQDDVVEAIKKVSWIRYEEDEQMGGFVVIPQTLRRVVPGYIHTY